MCTLFGERKGLRFHKFPIRATGRNITQLSNHSRRGNKHISHIRTTRTCAQESGSQSDKPSGSSKRCSQEKSTQLFHISPLTKKFTGFHRNQTLTSSCNRWLPFHFLLSPPLFSSFRTFLLHASRLLLVHGFRFSHNVSFFIWQFPAFLHCFSFAKFHRPFCAMKPSISKLFTSLLCSFLVILLFSPSILQFVLPRDLAKFFGVHLFRSAAIRQLWSHSLPRISRTLTGPYQNFSLPFFSILTRILVHHICLAFSSRCFLFRISHIDTCLLPHHSVRCFILSILLST